MKKHKIYATFLDGDLYCTLTVCKYAKNNRRRLAGKKPIRRRTIKKALGLIQKHKYYAVPRRGGSRTLYYREDQI